MWYVIQVAGGREEDTAVLIQKQISPEVMRESFVPRREKIKKIRGSWCRVEEILFPGYVFTETEHPEKLFMELKHITRLTKLLQDGKFFFIPLSSKEEEMIRSIGDARHVTRVSRIHLEKSQPELSCVERDLKTAVGSKTEEKSAGLGCKNVVILSGPLKGHEGWIVRYNLHKREVTVRLPFMRRDIEVRMGIEIVEEKKKT